MIAARSATLALLLAAAPIAAQEDQSPAMGALAGDLAYGFCPLFLNGDMLLADNPALLARGFPAQPQTGVDPRFPDFELLAQARSDGEIALGGIPQALCQVTIIGPQAEAALVMLRSGIDELGLALSADIANSGPGPQGRGMVETLIAPLPDSGVIRVQFIQASLSDGTAMATFQIMFQEQ